MDVDVDGVTHTGSGVVEISYVTRPPLSEIDGFSDPGHMHGYAITVDLGDQGLLFVVDRGSDVVDPTTHRLLFPELTDLRTLPLKVAGFRYFGGPAVGDLKTVFREIQLKKGPRDIPFDILPMSCVFVTSTTNIRFKK